MGGGGGGGRLQGGVAPWARGGWKAPRSGRQLLEGALGWVGWHGVAKTAGKRREGLAQWEEQHRGQQGGVSDVSYG